MPADLSSEIQAASCKLRRPDGDDYLSIAVAETRRIAAGAGVSEKKVEIAALENGIIPERYTRNMKILSIADQIKMLRATVAVVGLGGLGGTVIEMLARMGIGRLILVDGDAFDDSNLNRQITCRVANIGTAKADAARDRVREINPGIALDVHRVFLEEENAAALIRGSDVVVDCLDSLRARYYLAAACRQITAPLIVAAVAGLAGQVTVFFPEDNGFETIYGAPGEVPDKGVETRLGNLAPIVGMIANVECAEVVKILLGRGSPLRKRMLLVDLMDSTFETVDLS